MKKKSKRIGLPLLVFYAAALAFWLVMCTVRFATDMAYSRSGVLYEDELNLQMNAAFSSGIRYYTDFWQSGEFVTLDPDPFIIFAWPDGRYVTQVKLHSETISRPSGAVSVLYTNEQGEAFTPQKQVWADTLPDGSYVFDLGGQTIYNLRLDTGDRAGVLWVAHSLIVNPPIPFVEYYLPDAQSFAALLFLPLIAWAVMREIVLFVKPLLDRRRFERRHLQEAQQSEQT